MTEPTTAPGSARFGVLRHRGPRDLAVSLALALALLAPSAPIRAASYPWDQPAVDGAYCIEGILGAAANDGVTWRNYYKIGVSCGRSGWAGAFGLFRPDGSLFAYRSWISDPFVTAAFEFRNLVPAGRWTYVACIEDTFGRWGCDTDAAMSFIVTHAGGETVAGASPAAVPAPKIAVYGPPSGATGISRARVFKIQYDRAIARPTTTNARLIDLATGKAVAVTVSLSGMTVSVTPRLKLLTVHRYRLTVSGIKGTTGKVAPTLTLIFTTGR